MINLTDKFRHMLYRAELLVAGHKITPEQRIEMEKSIEKLREMLDMCTVSGGKGHVEYTEEVGC